MNMKSVVRFSLKQKIFYNLMFVLMTVAGFLAMSELPAERYPNVNFGEVVITTVYPGADAELVQGFITTPIQETITSVEGIDYIKASSRAGINTSAERNVPSNTTDTPAARRAAARAKSSSYTRRRFAAV